MKIPVDTDTRTQAILFDMDATLVDSTRAVEHVWSRWANRHALPSDMVLHTIHGVRITETVKYLAPAGADIDRETAMLVAKE